MISRRSLLLTLAGGSFSLWRGAFAQFYPDRLIKIIVPYPPGGPSDVMARLIAQRLAAIFSQHVIVENRPGAGGTIGAKAAASAEPDGYTLLLANLGALVITPILYKAADYDPLKTFAPIALGAVGSFVLVVNPAVPVKTIREFVAYAKANPGKLNHGAALGTSPHLLGELFRIKTGTNIVYIPYKGTAPAIADLIGGQVQMTFEAKSALYPLIQEGKIKPLAVTSAARWPELPEVPTMAESGFDDFIFTFWQGLVAPAKTPAAVVDRLNAAVNEAIRSPEMSASLATLGMEGVSGSPHEFSTAIANDAQRWAEIVRLSGAKLE
jgi:tripartite-type tricarboxylate transporter receptor subunit TctC